MIVSALSAKRLWKVHTHEDNRRFIEPDSGEVEIGQTIKIGYFGQEVDIDPELRVIDYVKEAAEFVRTADGLVSASAMLERFYSHRSSSTVL